MCAITLGVILLNYIFYYADDLVFAFQAAPHATWFTDVAQLLSAPVTLYVEAFEKRYYLHIFLVGRVINYLIEMTYFLIVTGAVYIPLLRVYQRKLKR